VNQPRLIPFDEVLNFRDLGGYPTSDGRVTRWRRLYRSNVLHDLSVEDLELFQSLGIVTVVDLRSPGEVERTGYGLLADEPIRFVNSSVLSNAALEERIDGSLTSDYLVKRYQFYLETGAAAMAHALEEMAKEENYPLVFNCFFGKDRTGVLAALVLSCVGVDREAVIEDYAFTATRVPLILEKMRQDPVHRDTIDQTDPMLLAANEMTMSRFLDEVDRRYGGARAWAEGVGVSRSTLDALSDRLLE
jgi:protein-tyrosine phosphatase